MSESTVRDGAATFVKQDKPTKAFPKPLLLRAHANEFESFLRYKSPAPRLATIFDGELVLTQEGAVAGDVTLQVQLIGDDVDMRDVTWNERPTDMIGPIASLTKSAPADGEKWRFDVTDLYQDIADGFKMNGMRLRSTAGNLIRFHSPYASPGRPVLNLTWSSGPRQPVDLKPGDGAVVSVDKWTQRVDYTDRRGDDPIQSIQVRIDAAQDEVTPDYDTGEVPTTKPLVDLSRTDLPGGVYAGLGSGAVTQLQARVRDDSGKWSPWSDWVQIQRINKPTLSAVSPTGGGTVEELTPPITWNVSSQTHWQMLVYVDDRSDKPVYNSGKRKGTALSHTIPKRTLRDGDEFRVVIRSWDGEPEREATAGDPIYSKLTLNLTVAVTAGTTAPTVLTAASEVDRPVVTLVVTRAATPDSWTLTRQEVGSSFGQVAIDTDIDPEDVRLTGTTYELVDHSARPGIEYRYRARAEVNGKLSTGEPTADITLTHTAVRLWDPAVEDDWVVLGERSVNDGGGEDFGDTVYALGNPDPIRAISGLTGLVVDAGPLMLRTRDGRTWRQFEETLYRFKRRPARTYRLAYGTTNIPVLLGNLHVGEHEASRPDQPIRVVSFTAWQNGEHGWEA
jgi:hypothetical protein